MGSNASTTRGSKSGSDYTQALLDGARASGSGAVRASGSGVPPVVPAGGNEMGLSTAEVLRLREEFGYNEVKEKSVPAWKKFALNFWGPMPFLIELATIVSLVLRDWKDFAFLFALLLINGIVAFVEEFKAGNAIDALKNSLAPTARVLRDGAWTVLDAKELVPNDVVMMRLGDIVPADAKLCAGEPMEIDQSALTGESLPVTKYEGETVFQGSAIKRGELKAIVTHTGENSFFGKAAMLVDSVEKVGNFQKVLWNVAKILVAMATVLVRRPRPRPLVGPAGRLSLPADPHLHLTSHPPTAGQVLVIFFDLVFDPSKGKQCAGNANPELCRILGAVKLCLVLLVASIPIAMQVVCTTTMAVGSKHLSEKKAVVARLSAIEELAGMSILCSDKTGTLTKNQVRLKRSTSIDDPDIHTSHTSDPSVPTPPPHSSRSASPT